jgi:Ran GTPase-activating protein 1
MSSASITQADNGIFSIHGKGLKLTSKADIQPYVDILEQMGQDVKEIHLGGNTLGVEACQALASVIQTKKSLQARRSRPVLQNHKAQEADCT